MASCSTPQWSTQYTPQAELTVTQSASTDTTVTLSWALKYVTHGYVASTNGYGRAYSVVIDGKTVKSGTVNINGKSTMTVASGTTTINKGTSARNVPFSISFEFDITWTGVYGGTKTASGSIAIAAKTSYTISYNANGGSGAPSSQTKWHGTNLTLSSTKPSRSGYTFQGWSDSASDSEKWDAGGTYTWNQSCTLYAIWKANTYTVSYNANGGSGAPSSQTKTHGVNLTLSSTKPTRTNYTFKGWATTSGGGVAYASGAAYTNNASITLYAVWELAYTKPIISKLSISRCTSNGSLSDSGTYALVSFSWKTSQAVSSIKIEWKLEAETSFTNSTTVTASGTSGNVSQIIGAGALAVESSYTIRVTVADSVDDSDRTGAVSGQTFPFDAIKTDVGFGAAVGKAAEYEKTFDIAWLTRIRDHLCLGEKTGYLDGKPGVFISNEGFIHLQRTSAQNYNTYIAFLKDAGKSVDAQIQYDVDTDMIKMLGASGYYVDNVFENPSYFYSTRKDSGFVHLHPTTGARVNFGVGSGGVNRGIYDSSIGKWLFYNNGADTYIGFDAATFKPYYTAGDVVTVRTHTAGYVTNSSKEVHFCVPISRPLYGVSAISISSGDGFVLRQESKYTHGSSASTYALPSSYQGRYNGNNTIYCVATFASITNAVNNAPVGVDCEITITFS